jgi:hypothetical protein
MRSSMLHPVPFENLSIAEIAWRVDPNINNTIWSDPYGTLPCAPHLRSATQCLCSHVYGPSPEGIWLVAASAS